MGAFDNISEIPRRVMTLFFIVDTSGSMRGEKIASLNVAIREVLPEVKSISDTNADAEIKVAAMEFSSGCEWMYPQPMKIEDFQWRDVEAGGLTSLGEACEELNKKLSKTNGFMSNASGSFAPVIILLSDGEPTDDYKRGIAKLKENNWFKAAIKVAIGIGHTEDGYQKTLAEFTGNSEAVLTVDNKEDLRNIIRFVTVTSSQVQSKSSSVGVDAPADKETEVIEKITTEIKDNPDMQDVEIGVDVASPSDSDWDTAGW